MSREAIAKTDLKESTRTRYTELLGLLLGDCKGHTHQHSLRQHTIERGAKARPYERCLREIAELHGYASAKQARTVLGKYVSGQLRRDDLLAGDPLAGIADKDLIGPKPDQIRGGKSLAQADYDRVIEHLLSLNPADYLEPPKRGRWSQADRIAKAQNAIDLTLLQAATGLRISEGTQVTWTDHIEVTDDGKIFVEVTPDISKTGRGRRVPVLNADVAGRLLKRRNEAGGAGYVIGSPSNAEKRWEPRNCRQAVADLYSELADELGIELLRTERSHVWRATLNTMFLDKVPEAVRAAFFGHDAEMNRKSYTDLADVSGMFEAASARKLKAV